MSQFVSQSQEWLRCILGKRVFSNQSCIWNLIPLLISTQSRIYTPPSATSNPLFCHKLRSSATFDLHPYLLRLNFPPSAKFGNQKNMVNASPATEWSKTGSTDSALLSMDDVMQKRRFQIVVAATKDLGIGYGGVLPWKLPKDMKYFKELTTKASPGMQNAVIMGRKTWESIPSRFRPLPGRYNVVLSRTAVTADKQYPNDVILCKDFDSALSLLTNAEYTQRVDNIFVIGGGQVFRESLDSPLCEAIHLTEIEGNFACDTFIPAIDTSVFRIWRSLPPVTENGARFSFLTYVRTKAPATTLDSLVALADDKDEGKTKGSTEKGWKPEMVLGTDIVRGHEEYQYLNMIQDVLDSGNVRGDRTGTGTISKFGCQMRFNLRKSFPLLTTKRVFWRGVVEELLWFISGSTNAKILKEKGIGIWDGNGSRAYLDSIGLTEREEGDLGPVYGFQWRHFGAKYTNMHEDYTGKGVDQLADVIHKIKTNPEDRRIIMSAWNPSDLKLMALPPCHMFAQFYVESGELSCLMYQRSCDLGLGVPFNIASYSLLTCMIAQVCGLRPGEFVHVLGDAHVYLNHVDPLKQQLLNTPRPFPVLHINPEKSDIDSFTAEDFELLGYEPHQKIAMKMAV